MIDIKFKISFLNDIKFYIYVICCFRDLDFIYDIYFYIVSYVVLIIKVFKSNREMRKFW